MIFIDFSYVVTFFCIIWLYNCLWIWCYLCRVKSFFFIQDKTGPMGQGYGFHAGKWGFLQPVADGLHLFFKEDIIPATADRPLFILAPFLIFIGMFVGIIANTVWRGNYNQ